MPVHLSKPGQSLSLFFLSLCFVFNAATALASESSANKKCLYISSYHEGDEWSDEIEASIRASLNGHCTLQKFDMDTKRVTSLEEIFKITNQIIKHIEEWQPDVVITSDDNAAKYLIAPHYKDDKIPFVFSGVNWTVDEYGFPYKNVTGIVEVAPIQTMFREAVTLSNVGRRAVFLGPDVLSEKKNFDRIKLVAEEFQVQIEPVYYSSFSQWSKAIENIQEYDFAIIGSNAGIEDWDIEVARQKVLESTKKPTFTTAKSMMPYTIFGFTNLAAEQGEWAAEVAIRILNGTSPEEIPLASNKKWEFWVNEEIFNRLETPPGRSFLRKAKRVQIEVKTPEE